MDIKKQHAAEIKRFVERSKSASEKSPVSLFLIEGKYLKTVFTATIRTQNWLDLELDNYQHVFTAKRAVIGDNIKAMVPVV